MKHRRFALFAAAASLSACAGQLATVEAPSGAGWELDRQGYQATFDSASRSTTTTTTGGYGSVPARTETTTVTTQIHKEYSENLADKRTVTSDDIQRTFQVGTNIREYQLNGSVRSQRVSR